MVAKIEVRTPSPDVTGTGWQRKGHRAIQVGPATDPVREDCDVRNRLDSLDLLSKRDMKGVMDLLLVPVDAEAPPNAENRCSVPGGGVTETGWEKVSALSAQIGAQHGERNKERLTHRNGYRSRDWDTRVGTMELRIPKIREGSYFPSLLEPRRRSEKALLNVVQQAHVEGLSTRRVDDLIKSLGCDGISKSQVSRICRDFGPGGGDFAGPAAFGSWLLSLRVAGCAHPESP